MDQLTSDQVIRKAIRHFWQGRIARMGYLPLLVLCAAAVAAYDKATATWLDRVLIGIGLDITGAILLAKGFVMKELRHAHHEALTMPGLNNALVRSALIQRAEAQIGAVFLTLGFCLQLSGNLAAAAGASVGRIDTRLEALLVTVAIGVVGAGVAYVGTWRAQHEWEEHVARNDGLSKEQLKELQRRMLYERSLSMWRADTQLGPRRSMHLVVR